MSANRHSYLGLDSFKTALGSGDTRSVEDSHYLRVLEAVSQEIDDWTDRTFVIRTETRDYTARFPDSLPVDDLLAVTALTMDQSGSRNYSVTLSTADYDLVPYNAANDDMPYTAIEIAPNGSYTFTDVQRGIRVAGRWGYWQDLKSATNTVSTTASLSSAGTSLILSASGTIEAGMTLLLSSAEQVYVTAVSGTTVTIERAVNGTTNTTHSTAASIQYYRYPAPIVEAVQLQAARIYKRKDAPFGGVAGPSEMLENVVVVSDLDSDVKKLVEPYKRKTWLAV